MKPVYDCPNCGASVTFKSSVSLMAVCGFCRSNLIRRDMDLDLLGVQSNFMQDFSPFLPGTTGEFEGKKFELLGRVKVLYEGGTWSEWYAFFPNGNAGWLAEAQGFYMMSFEIPVPDSLNKGVNLSVGDKVNIGKDEFYVDDRRVVRYAGLEGEIPWRINPGEEFTSIDLRGPSAQFANLVVNKNERSLYLGKYVEFDSLNLKNLKQVEGWKL